jgi:hypothetical protein
MSVQEWWHFPIEKLMRHFRKGKVIAISEPREAKIKPGRVLDYVLEMYASPSDVKLRSVPNGRAGALQDRMRMRSYYKSTICGAK